MRFVKAIQYQPASPYRSHAEMADQSIHAACKIMHKNNIGSVIVVKEYTTEPIGIITEKDIVRIIERTNRLRSIILQL